MPPIAHLTRAPIPLRIIPHDAIGAPWPSRAVSTDRRAVNYRDERGHGEAALHTVEIAA